MVLAEQNSDSDLFLENRITKSTLARFVTSLEHIRNNIYLQVTIDHVLILF
jgi:hypothetical protein